MSVRRGTSTHDPTYDLPHVLRVVSALVAVLAMACRDDAGSSSPAPQAPADTNHTATEQRAAHAGRGLEALALRTFATPGFDFILPDTDTSVFQATRRFRFVAARGEFESVSIGMHASATVESLHANLTDLTGPRGTIPRDVVDVRIIKVWEQAGLDVLAYPSGMPAANRHPVQVPELLVYDDSQEFHAGFEVPEARLVDGRAGRALHIDASFGLGLPLGGLDPDRGAIAFWFRPHWDAPAERGIHFLFNLRASETDEINLFYHGERGSLFAAVDRGAERYRSVSKPIVLQRRRWYRIVFTWVTSERDASRFACAVDGEWVLEQNAAFAANAPPSQMYLGSQNGKRYAADADFDGLTVYREPVPVDLLRTGDMESVQPLYDLGFDTRAEIAARASVFRLHARPLPTLRRPFHTRLAAGVSKQLWVTVQTPAHAAAGAYVGRLTLSAPGYAPLAVELELEVRAFDLMQSPKIHGIYFQHLTLDTEPSPHSMNATQYVAALRDLRQHGLNSLRVDWISAQYFGHVLELARAEGLGGIVLLVPPPSDADLQAAVRLSRARGFEPYFYTVDECNDDASLAQQIMLSRRVHAAGGRVTTALLKQTQDRLLDPRDPAYDLLDPASGQSFRSRGVTTEAVDAPIYHATYLPYAESANHLRVDLRPDAPLHDYCRSVFANRATKASRLEMYYWPSWTQRPNVHRVMSGFFLWASGMDGTFPHAYMALGNAFNDVFDDYDNVGVLERDMMTVYPSAEGPIPTTQWEAMREGIDDSRYLATLEHELQGRAADDDVRVRISAGLAALLEEYLEPARWLDPAYAETYTPAKCNHDRERVARWIQELRDRRVRGR